MWAAGKKVTQNHENVNVLNIGQGEAKGKVVPELH
jgi:hypothetical protein